MGGSEAELQDFTIRLKRTAGAYGTEVGSEKSRVTVNIRTQQTTTSIILNGQKLEEVDSFKYLGSTLANYGSSTKEVKRKLSLSASAMTRLNVI